MKYLIIISRIITGTVFIFSGTIKAIDPMGTVFKLQDYFNAFGIEALKPLALVLTILLCTAEFLAGFTVIFNLRHARGVWLVMLLMAIFTPLTLVLALTNPVSDCGCFGDAIKLTNWQTFFKNIFILIPSVFLFINREQPSPERKKADLFLTATAGVLFIVFMIYNKIFLPVIDFLPYSTGTNIPSKMEIPAGAPVDKYETTFIYEKAGVKKEFTLDTYPSGDTTWKFIEQKSVLVTKGYQPPIHDFRIISADEGTDLTDLIINSRQYILLMISRKLEDSDSKKLEKGFELGKYCNMEGIDYYVVTASGSEVIKGYANGLKFCQADETTLKTMVRTNPGYILLKEGNIVGKWSWANMPDKEKLMNVINK